LVALAACSGGGKVLSRQEFRDAYAEAIKHAAPGVTVTPVAGDALEVRRGDKDPARARIDNAYAAYRANPRDLDEILGHYAKLVADAVDNEPTYAAEDLVVLVRPTTYAKGDPALGAVEGPDGEPLTRPLAGDVLLIVAADRPDSFVLPAAGDLRERLKLDAAAIWTRAAANTHARLKGPAPTSKVDIVTTGEGIASSLMAQDDYWDSPAMKARGETVVSPIGRDRLVILHGPTADEVAAWRRTAAEDDREDLLSQSLFVRRGGKWEPLP